MIRVAACLAIASLASVACAGRSANVVTYPVPDAVADSPYSVAVDGQVVPIERAGAIEGAYYVRVQVSKTARATVAVKPFGKAEFTLKPERFRENVTSGEREISFDIGKSGPRILTAKVDGKPLWPLVIIVDDLDTSVQPSRGQSVFNVRDYGVTSEGIQTAHIQKALDACAARKGGGTVYFGPGVYHTGTIRIRDNTDVYLAPGALIVGSTNPDDYPVDPGFVERGSHGPTASNSRLIMFDHCVNSKLFGYGVIEGMGHIVRNEKKRHVQIVDVTASRNIRIENVVLRNSCGWTLHILGCDRVYVDNLKILNDYAVGNTDGIDPDCSRNVFVTRYFGFCGDDAVAIKTTGNSAILKPCVNIEFKDCTVMTRKTAYKIGTETYADIYDVLFERCDALNSSRGIGLWECDGHTISGVTYRDMDLDLHEIPGEGWSGEPIRAIIEERHGIGAIKDVAFERVRFSSPYSSTLAGTPTSKLDGFTFTDCEFAVRPREIKFGPKPVIGITNARDITMNGTTLKWLTDDKANWTGFISQEGAENVVIRGELPSIPSSLTGAPLEGRIPY